MSTARLKLSVVIYAAITCVGCAPLDRGRDPESSKLVLVPVVSMRWDSFKEREEILHLLEVNGIRASTPDEVTLMFSISVPKPDAEKAILILRTNHLTVAGTGNVHLIPPRHLDANP